MARRSGCALAVLLAAGLAAGEAAGGEPRSCGSARPKIVGGSQARLGDWPGQAVLRLNSEDGRATYYFCGGTAIAARFVLTAAHCVTDFLTSLSGPFSDAKGNAAQGRLEAVVGTGDLRSVEPSRAYPVEQVIVHETFRSAVASSLALADAAAREAAVATATTRVGHDIALLKVGRDLEGPFATLSLSASADLLSKAPAQVRVAGFGRTEHNIGRRQAERFDRTDGRGVLQAGSARLLETAIETVSADRCRDRYKDAVIGEGQICAGLEQGGRDSCNGDSGGPLVVEDASGCPRQIGIVSWGAGCALERAYGVYTRVSAHAEWIERHTGPLKGARSGSAEPSERQLSEAQLEQALRQIRALLGEAGSGVTIAVKGGNRVPLGNEVVFEAASRRPGRLLILDVGADRKVTLIYPNRFVPAADRGAIEPGRVVSVPGPGYSGFTAFRASEPVGKGRILMLVVPKEFDVHRFAARTELLAKGFEPVAEPPSYLMRLIRQIELALGQSLRSGRSEADERRRWGYAIADYEIVR